MSTSRASELKPLAPGAILALLSIAFGFVLGGSFGAAEDSIKGHLAASADAVVDSVYDGDIGKRDAVVSKSWVYMKRAHLHGGAIGAAALASIVLLGLLGNVGLLERVSAAAFGAGALLYAVFWLAAGLAAPGLGSTGTAKDAYQILAIPGAGLCLIGIGGTLLSTFRQLVLSRE
jgi:hypothetical protein